MRRQVSRRATAKIRPSHLFREPFEERGHPSPATSPPNPPGHQERRTKAQFGSCHGQAASMKREYAQKKKVSQGGDLPERPMNSIGDARQHTYANYPSNAFSTASATASGDSASPVSMSPFWMFNSRSRATLEMSKKSSQTAAACSRLPPRAWVSPR